MILILGYFGLSNSLAQVDGPRKSGAHHYQHCCQEERYRRFVVSQRPRPQIMILSLSRKSYKRDYNLTEDGYRQRFRTCSPEEGENPSMFIVRLKAYLERWMKMAEAP
ncbi:hypothetical protein RRG08_031635 [Elysia crispata]|uniref:Uncharacterized protein n=1 Tax=Elysia crispata TaxID=231223 RepID=A0AAE1ABM2_9GAST|nr:hypothetical protein RRG08_031635 [Elysia crispata]